MTTTAPHPDTDKNLDATLASVNAQISRTDSKASLLLAFDGAALAGIASLADKPLPLATKVIGGLAALVLAVAADLLLRVVRPRLSGTGHTPAPGSFPHLAQLTRDEIRDVMAQDHRFDNVKILSGLAVAKFTALTKAVDLIRAALALLVLAAAAAPASLALAAL
ncbi:Pycsar system effector family protein [Streptomyces sp. N2A]|uniref:Pycsar system effector family protein n=1 Tax=Streptomyces sp. N2A TaxID=3073936 RepID=UPI00287042D3|nr:Pycsar system effector family protein [Streptomyces sp. N2A]